MFKARTQHTWPSGVLPPSTSRIVAPEARLKIQPEKTAQSSRTATFSHYPDPEEAFRQGEELFKQGSGERTQGSGLLKQGSESLMQGPGKHIQGSQPPKQDHPRRTQGRGPLMQGSEWRVRCLWLCGVGGPRPPRQSPAIGKPRRKRLRRACCAPRQPPRGRLTNGRIPSESWRLSRGHPCVTGRPLNSERTPTSSRQEWSLRTHSRVAAACPRPCASNTLSSTPTISCGSTRPPVHQAHPAC